MAEKMILKIWDVEHGACAMLQSFTAGVPGRLAMIDSGNTATWDPSTYITRELKRSRLDYLFITNADQDHMSDLDGLWNAGITIPTWYRNPSLKAADYRAIKSKSGPLTRDAQRYAKNLDEFTAPVSEPFDTHMGGITAKVFWNKYPAFQETNDLSLAIFIKFGAFKILFPGDLEAPGWRALLQNPSFTAELAGTTILVASHHGRENGYCPEVFNFCHPRAVVMSDKAIVHDTQKMAQTYRTEVNKHHPMGVVVSTTQKNRRVLTTRRDGHIIFDVLANGDFDIFTEYKG